MRYRVAVTYKGLEVPLLTSSFRTAGEAWEWIVLVESGEGVLPSGLVRDPSGAVLLGERGRMSSFAVVPS